MRSFVIYSFLAVSCGGSPGASWAPPPVDAGPVEAAVAGQLGAPCNPNALDATSAGCHYLGAVCFALHTVGDLGALCTAPHAAADPAEDYCGRCSYACDTEPSVTAACPALGGVCVQYSLADNALCERLP